MKEILKRGATSNILRVFLMDNTVTTGAGKTGLTNASSGLIISTIADLEATATTYTSAASNVETITTLGTFAAPTAGKCRFKEVDATNFPGVYEIQIADARFAVSNTTQLLVSIQCTGVAPVFVEYQLIAVDLLDTVRLGLTALPNVASGSAGAIITSGTGTAQLSTTSGNVTVGTNNDKTGYSLTQAFPTNFSSLAITAGGAVTAGTVSDKTGYSLTQAFPTNFSALAITVGGAVTAGTVSDKTGYSLTQSFPSNFSSLAITAGGAVTVGTNNDKTGYSLTTTPPTANSIADAVWGADKDTPYAGGTYGSTTFGRRVLRGASTQVDVSVTGSNHVAADIHELQPAVISAGDFSAGAIDANALAADAVTEIAQGILTEATSTTTYAAGDVGNILGRLHNMIEADGVDFRYTTNSLEQAPSGGAGSWPLNNDQTTGLKRMITAIVGIGGETATPGVLEFDMIGDTTTLQITQSVDGNDRLNVQEI